jgi:DNA-directed RNA polymerase specialized sigma24 family protein
MVAHLPSLLDDATHIVAESTLDSASSDRPDLVTTLFEQFRTRAVAYAHRLVGGSDAEDVVQEAFLKLARCRSLTPAHVNAPFILAATRNAAMTFLKRRGLERKRCTQANELRGSTRCSGPTPDRLIDESFLEELTPGQREALILIEVMGLTETQASVALEISRPVVHAKKFAAVQSLRARFISEPDAKMT